MNFKVFALSTVVALGIGMLAHPARAVTQCETNVTQVWAGNDGTVWVDFANGLGVPVLLNNPGREAMLSLATTALVTGRKVVVRLQADNAPCTGARSDLLGLYLV
ncbi:hypothetical protein ATDW_26070 [Asticcacaulis sp. DW145]|uniref:hypothetical protein n=1 Tax=Asticcacaulis sp. DW145 TaxID=3095608 RepID=UPI00308AAEF4|nr:hypothetical protein ATDW_26070 [Asticcacaulis sp. DW145]